MDDKFEFGRLSAVEVGNAMHTAFEQELRGPFAAAPADEQVTSLEWGIFFPSGIVDVRPSAKLLLHPIMRNYYSIMILEQMLGRTAVARSGYVELVLK